MKNGQALVQTDARANRARPSSATPRGHGVARAIPLELRAPRPRRRRATLLFLGVLAVGVLALTFALRSAPPARPSTTHVSTAQTSEAFARRAELTRLLTVLASIRPEPASSPGQQPPGDDQRDATTVAADPVGAAIPMLSGMPKVKQLEILKAMMLLPDNKLMSQMPQLANAPEKPLSERVALAHELGTQLISSLEDEGVEYELPPGYTPIGAQLEPPPESQGHPE